MNPATGTRSTDPAKPSSRVWRTLLVKGGNLVHLQVKVVREHVIYVVCEPKFNLSHGKQKFTIMKGALLIRNTEHDADGHKFFMIYNDGIYDALRSQGNHVPESYKNEQATIEVLKSSLDWGIKQTWFLTKDSDPEKVGQYGERLGGVDERLAKVRDDNKKEARKKTARGKTLTDSRGRFNPSSRSPILWSADHRLDGRVKTTRRIRPKIGARHWDLIALADQAWKVKRDFENEILQALRWWQDGRQLTEARALAMAERLEKLAGSLRSVSLAPYSRRGFPRSADDLDKVVLALREGRYEDARRDLDKCRRAFKLMDARRKGEEICTTASLVAKAKITPSVDDIDRLDLDLDAFEDMLYESGQSLDHGFDHEVIEPRVMPNLRAVREAAHSLLGYQADEVYTLINGMVQPL